MSRLYDEAQYETAINILKPKLSNFKDKENDVSQ